MYSKILSLNTVLVGFFFVVVLLYLIRKREMKERYIMFWFGVAVGVMLLLVSEKVLYFLVAFVGAQTPSSAILFFAVAALLLLNVHYSAKISRLENLTTHLVQEMGILFNLAKRQDVPVEKGHESTSD